MQVQRPDGNLAFWGSRIKLENRFKEQQFQASGPVSLLQLDSTSPTLPIILMELHPLASFFWQFSYQIHSTASIAEHAVLCPCAAMLY
jgi:hypothetical protein